jgi:hypothetical protein
MNLIFDLHGPLWNVTSSSACTLPVQTFHSFEELTKVFL